MAIQINTPDTASSEQLVTLNRKSYRVKNNYNSRFDTWSITVLDTSGNIVIAGEKILPFKDILTRYVKDNILGGILFVSSTDETRVSRDNYGLDKTHTLTFATFEEVEALTNV